MAEKEKAPRLERFGDEGAAWQETWEIVKRKPLPEIETKRPNEEEPLHPEQH